MKTITQHLRDHLLESRGVVDMELRAPPLEELKKSEWSSEFETLMRNRLIMGALRYGPIGGNKPTYDHVRSAIVRLTKFIDTGNAEHLVDAANLCLVTFEEKAHNNFHFHSSDDGYHSPIKEK